MRDSVTALGHSPCESNDAAQPGLEIAVERSLSGRRWLMVAERPSVARAISQQHDLPEIVGRVLAGRGLEPRDVPGFLEPRLRDLLPDPSHLLDLDRAVERLVAAIGAAEAVGLIGDYDVDGATSTALVTRYLEALGAPVHVRIPDRLADGYGPNERVLGELSRAGCRLVVCLDSGTTAFAPLAAARAVGLDVIVVDHHSAEAELPPALAVINPNRRDQTSPLGDLAAVGVAFVLLVALNRALKAEGRFAHSPAPDLLAMLDLVALGTVCDVVPLRALNRAFVVQGLKVARQGANPGLVALTEAAGITAIDNAKKFGFMLGPRLNAGGRMGESGLAAALLTTADLAQAGALAVRLDALNAERQAVERGVLEAAIAAVASQVEAAAPVLVAAGDGWHVGIVGIVASRLVERFARPAVVIGLENGIGKGSGRSCPGYDLGAAVIAARQAGILREGGGHPMAAGLTIDAGKLGDLARFLATMPVTTQFAPGRAELGLEGTLSIAAINLALAGKLGRLAPFGAGHAEPRFLVAAERVLQPRIVGRGHVSCLLAAGQGPAVRAIAFRAADNGLDRALLDGGPLCLAGRVRAESWQGQERVCLEIDDVALA